MSTSERFSVAYQNRREAGRELAQRLLGYQGRTDAIVLAVSPESVPVADEVAATLELPLDVFLLRSVAVPGYEGVSMGWVARAAHVVDKAVVDHAGMSMQSFVAAAAGEQRELDRQESYYRNGRPASKITRRTVILVGDGLTKESSLPSAVEALHRLAPAKIVVAIPVAVPVVADKVRKLVDELVFDRTLDAETALEAWYDEPEVDDETVRLTLRHAAERGR
jgi:predicted phosphoribosyltransferase